MAKRGDDGIKLLTTSSMLQMAGRAGRRGMDEKGDVIVLATPYETVHDAKKIITSPCEDISSQFTPSYGLVVNLAKRGDLKEAKRLIKSSFAEDPQEKWDDFLALMEVLIKFECLRESDGTVLPIGNAVAALGVNNPLLVISILNDDAIKTSLENIQDTATFAAFISVIAGESRGNNNNGRVEVSNSQLLDPIKNSIAIAKKLIDAQLTEGGNTLMQSNPVSLEFSTIELIQSWCSGTSFDDLTAEHGIATNLGLSAGDTVRVLNRSIDACRQISELELPNFKKIAKLARFATRAMDRQPVKDDLNIIM